MVIAYARLANRLNRTPADPKVSPRTLPLEKPRTQKKRLCGQEGACAPVYAGMSRQTQLQILLERAKHNPKKTPLSNFSLLSLPVRVSLVFVHYSPSSKINLHKTIDCGSNPLINKALYMSMASMMTDCLPLIPTLTILYLLFTLRPRSFLDHIPGVGKMVLVCFI